MTDFRQQEVRVNQAGVDPRTGTFIPNSSRAISNIGSAIGGLFQSRSTGTQRSPTTRDLFNVEVDRALTLDGLPEDPEFTAAITKERDKLLAKSAQKGQKAIDMATAIAVARHFKAKNPERALEIEATFELNQGAKLGALERELYGDIDAERMATEKRERDEQAKLETEARTFARQYHLNPDLPAEELFQQNREFSDRMYKLEEKQRKVESNNADDSIDYRQRRRDAEKLIEDATSEYVTYFAQASGGVPPNEMDDTMKASTIARLEQMRGDLYGTLTQSFKTEAEFKAATANLEAVHARALEQLNRGATVEALQQSMAANRAILKTRFFNNNQSALEASVLTEIISDTLNEKLAGMIHDGELRDMTTELAADLIGTIMASNNAISTQNLLDRDNPDSAENMNLLKLALGSVTNYLVDREQAFGSLEAFLQTSHKEEAIQIMDGFANIAVEDNRVMHASLQLMTDPKFYDFIGKASPAVADKWVQGMRNYKDGLREYANEKMLYELGVILNIQESPDSPVMAAVQAWLSSPENLSSGGMLTVSDEGVVPTDSFSKFIGDLESQGKAKSVTAVKDALGVIESTFSENNFYIRKIENLWGKDLKTLQDRIDANRSAPKEPEDPDI